LGLGHVTSTSDLLINVDLGGSGKHATPGLQIDLHARIAGDAQALDARALPRRNRDLPRRQSEFTRDEPAQRVIGLTLEWRGAHARFEHDAAVGAPFDAFDRITPAARRETHVERKAVRQSSPRF